MLVRADHRGTVTVSDHLTGRLVSSLARASARKRAYAAGETRRETSTQRSVSVWDEPVGRGDARGRSARANPTAASTSAMPGGGSWSPASGPARRWRITDIRVSMRCDGPPGQPSSSMTEPRCF